MIYAQAEITMVFRHKETIIATQNIHGHISMLYFIQCKQRRLYNDECLLKFCGGYLMGAILKKGEGQRLRLFRLVLLERIRNWIILIRIRDDWVILYR